MKPTILISKCLGFDACRYDGQKIPNGIVDMLKEYVEFIPICPEMGIGLSTPRKPLSLILNNLIERDSEKDFTKKMNDFSISFLSKIDDLDGALFMSRSPSCSIYSAKIHEPNIERHTNGAGLFAKKVKEKFPNIPMEEKGRINNYDIRENFLTKVFLLKNFKERVSLEDFHKKNKFLLMSFSREIMKELGQINSKNNNEAYKQKLYELLKKDQTINLITDALIHIYGFFKDKINQKEKEFFSKIIKEYQKEKAPKSEILTLLKDWAIRFNDEYILNQTIFNPYPEELNIITDSGKGRDL